MSERFKAHTTELPGVYSITPKLRYDERGYFERLFCQEEFQEWGLTKPIAQINHTLTKRCGTIRGLHFQYPPHAEMKLVRCLRGAIFDVAVDIRRESPTFLRWHGETLDAETGAMLLLPEGIAHGFQTLTPDVELLYCHTAAYHPEAEGGLHFADPALNIQWKLPSADVSRKDSEYPFIGADFQGITL